MRDQRWVADGCPREVHRDRHPPRSELHAAGRYPAVDIPNVAVALGGWQEGTGHDQLPGGISHPQQKLVVSSPSLQIDDRLSMQLETFFHQGGADLADPGDVLELATQGVLLGMALRHIHDLREEDVEITVWIKDPGKVNRTPHHGTVGTYIATSIRTSRRPPPLHLSRVVELVEVLGVDDVGDAKAAQLLLRPSDELAVGLVNAQVTARGGVDERHRHRCLLEALAKALLRPAQLAVGRSATVMSWTVPRIPMGLPPSSSTITSTEVVNQKTEPSGS